MAHTICSPRVPLVIAAGALAAVCGWAGTSSAATTPASSSAAVSASAGCTASSLRVTNGGIQGTAGSYYEDVVFTNTSHRTCQMSGYPGEALLSASGKQIGAAATHPIGQLPVLVKLAPGAKAHATLRVVDAMVYPRSECRPVHAKWLRTTPPVSPQRSVRMPSSFIGCANQAVKLLSVTAVQQGAGTR